MCGITGIVTNGAEIPPGTLERMTGALQHRGPDAEGMIQLSGCELGHKRLSVIDLSTGDQPMHDGTSRYWIVFNGEIYNYRELRRDLEKVGWTFRTTSDTEVLLCTYQEYGESAPQYLNGQFAFAIWDNEAHRLFAARDRFGEKPFYWAPSQNEKLFLFASEIKAILASGLLHPKLDYLSVDAFLILNHVTPDRTIYENIRTLRPGCALSWDAGRVRTWSYWQPAYSQEPAPNERELIDRLRFLIGQAVKRQMVADVPVGAFLSGGLDSSTVVALMSQHADRPIKTFSVGFHDLINELPYAREVAQRYQTEHHEIQMDIPVGELLERMVQVYDEPFADSSNIPTYLVSEFASHDVKVVLSGDGGDEVFGGYLWYSLVLDQAQEHASTVDYALAIIATYGRRLLANAGLRASREGDAAATHLHTLERKRNSEDWWQKRLDISTLFHSGREALWQERFPTARTEDLLRSLYAPDGSVTGMDRVTFFDVACYLPGDILVKVDRASMAHGLETRAPFLDVDLVEFVWSLPWQTRFQNGRPLKHLLRAASADLWPQSLRDRPKQGFGAPIDHWLLEPDVEPLLARVSKEGSALNTLLPGAGAALPAAPAAQQWALLCLGLWLELHSSALH